MVNNCTLAFFELLRAGLWEKEARLSQFNNIDYSCILNMAEEQSVVGLVTAGLEKVVDVNLPRSMVLVVQKIPSIVSGLLQKHISLRG